MTGPKAADAVTRDRMSRQSRRDTTPERAVRAALRSLGFSYRLNVAGLPGSPDIANKSAHWAIFVHGCYWHHHRGCSRATVPKKNRDWWLDKFLSNARRDARKIDQLEELGFDVLVVWECEASDASLLLQRLKIWFESRGDLMDGSRNAHKSTTYISHES